MSIDDLKEHIRAGDTRALARAATLVENDPKRGTELMAALFPFTGRAVSIGLTGPPGAGKSTLANALIRVLRGRGKKVGVIAVDPSSSFSRGALLGDRVRMQEHHSDQGVFVRSLATRGQLGGVSAATFETSLLLDAAGFDVVLIETVGVGQDEVDVCAMADVTVLVLVPGFGDDVQAIKAGVMEVADVFAINKADLPGSERLEQEIRMMQSLAHPAEGEAAAPVRRVVATEGRGVEELLDVVLEAAAGTRNDQAKRERWARRLREVMKQRVLAAVSDEAINDLADDVAQNKTDPFTAVDKYLAHSLPKSGVAIDHLGIATRTLAEALPFYTDQLGIAECHREAVDIEKVRVAMLPAGESRIELLEPTAADSPIARFLEKRGPGLHHVALRVDDLAAAVRRIRDAGGEILNEPRPGAGGHVYVFVHPKSTGGILLELIQK